MYRRVGYIVIVLLVLVVGCYALADCVFASCYTSSQTERRLSNVVDEEKNPLMDSAEDEADMPIPQMSEEDELINMQYHDLARNYRMPEKLGCPQSIFGAGTISGSISLTAEIRKKYKGTTELNDKLVPTSKGFLAPQVCGLTFVSRPNPLREHNGKLEYHDGVDYVAQLDTKLYPMYNSGEVVAVQYPYYYKTPPPYEKDGMQGKEKSGYGNNIMVRYRLGNDYVIVRYAQLLRIPSYIKVGSIVHKNWVVAYSGRSGIVDDNEYPHIHVEVFRLRVSDYGRGKKFDVNAQGNIEEYGKINQYLYRKNGVLQDALDYNPTKYTGTRTGDGYTFPTYRNGLIQPSFLAKCK